MSQTIECSPAERDLLLMLLTSRLGELRQEVHHSMVSTYTEQLKQTENLVKGLLGKLESMRCETAASGP